MMTLLSILFIQTDRSNSLNLFFTDNLPEWSMPDTEGNDVGTFDSSGAFVSTKVLHLHHVMTEFL